MKVMVVLGHPAAGSFNHAIATAAASTLEANGHQVYLHDLYQEGLDPVLTKMEISEEEVSDPVIKAHCDELTAADGYIVVHPNWWGQPPAVMKGWVDRVLRYGVAYSFIEKDGEEVGVGLLEGRKALVFNTCMTTEENDRAHYGDPLENLWRNCVFGFCGISDFKRRNFRMVQTISQEARQEMLDEVRQTVDAVFPASE